MDYIKYKKLTSRKCILELLENKQKFIKEFRFKKKQIETNIYEMKQGIKNIKDSIIVNRIKTLNEDYSNLSNNIDINEFILKNICFLDTVININLINEYNLKEKKLNYLIDEKKQLIKKEQNFINQSSKNKINKDTSNLQNILIINKVEYMNFITLLNTRLLTNLINYQRNIKDDIQLLELKKKTIISQINESSDKNVSSSKSIQYFEKKILKLESILTNIFK